MLQERKLVYQTFFLRKVKVFRYIFKQSKFYLLKRPFSCWRFPLLLLTSSLGLSNCYAIHFIFLSDLCLWQLREPMRQLLCHFPDLILPLVSESTLGLHQKILVLWMLLWTLEIVDLNHWLQRLWKSTEMLAKMDLVLSGDRS